MSKIILDHGNYQDLESYKNSVVIYDGTVDFCERFLKRGDRTIDQMIQAARSGKQNIVEGCMASGTSTETELKLIGVARASFEELLEDYHDHLRVHDLPLWEKTISGYWSSGSWAGREISPTRPIRLIWSREIIRRKYSAT